MYIKSLSAITFATFCLFGCSQSPMDGGMESDAQTATEAVSLDNQVLFDGLGALNLDITTSSPKAQKYFNQGMMLAWGFNHAAADLAFNEGAIADPDCAMCYWGSAFVLGANLNMKMVPSNAPRATKLTAMAMEIANDSKKGVSPKEKALIEALSKRYQAKAPADPTPLNEAYADAMRTVVMQFPNDAHILTLAADAQMNLHPWDYWLEDGTAKPWTTEITDLIEGALAIDPDYIGAIHLYIHAVEASNAPERAEPYADKLANLSPNAGHLVHMPAHIYLRVGRYHDSTLNNMKATEADSWFTSVCHSNSFIYLGGYVPHNWHFGATTAAIEGWQAQANLLADGTRDAITPQMLSMAGFTGSAQQFVAQPLFVDVRFSAWDEILSEPEPAKELLYLRSIWHYARGRAFNGKDDMMQAKAEAAKLDELRLDTDTRAMVNIGRNSIDSVLEIASLTLNGEILASEAMYEEAIPMLIKGVALEDSLRYTEPPDWFHPVRHSLGAAQLAGGDASAAEQTYLMDLKKWPENGWALAGLKDALVIQGETIEAEEVQDRLSRAWANADVPIPTPGSSIAVISDQKLKVSKR
jgi:tetratricopeptide (TPR) repeat protein